MAGAPRTIDVEHLQGAWFGDGPSFELVVHDRTILFEFDMKEHAYRLDGDLLIVTYDDGERRHRVVRLTDEEMEWESEATGQRSVLYRKGAWERSHARTEASSDDDRSTKRDWSVYRNQKYAYEIRYPDGVEVRETGPESRRDGASIRLGFKDYQAPVPALAVVVSPRTSDASFPSLGADVPGMTRSLADVELGNESVRLAQYRWKESGELAFAEVYLRGVVFRFDANSGVRDLRETQWWEIIATFRFLDRSIPSAKPPVP